MACSTVSSNNIPETDLKKSASSPSATLVEHNEEADLTVFKAIKKDRRCIKYVLAVCPAVLLFGYDGVLVSNLTAMPVFQYVPEESLSHIADSPIDTTIGPILERSMMVPISFLPPG